MAAAALSAAPPLAAGFAVLAAAAALLLLGAAAGGWWAPGGWLAQGLLGLLYAGALTLGDRPLDTTAPALGACLLLAGELAAVAGDLGRGAAVPAARWWTIGLVAAAGLAAGGIVLLAASAPVPAGAPATLLGAGAVVAVIALARAPRR